jgi:hypothetical protein
LSEDLRLVWAHDLHCSFKGNLNDIFFRFVSNGFLNMSLLKTLDHFVDFWIANYQLRMPLAMRLSFDLLELQISPENVWQVLRRIAYNVELCDVCDKVN